MIKKTIITLCILLACYLSYKALKKVNFNTEYTIGQKLDSLNNVIVYFNGGVDNVVQRNTKNGYNLGLEYQCVEFVKRYYFEYYNHKMPDSYGHAISFFNKKIPDNTLNKQRNLTQFTNPSISIPKQGDLIILKGSLFNRYGHVAIISKVTTTAIEIIQQNPGPFSPSRETFNLSKTKDNKWYINNERVLGWLRK